MTTILAVDPGLTNPGAAVMLDGKIVAAARVKVDKAWAKLEILDRCDRIGARLHEWFSGFKYPIDDPEPSITFVLEWPQWYGDNEKGIDPNDLAGLCGIAGSITARIRAGWREVLVKSPKPREVWGTVPKATTGNPWRSPRGQMLERRLGKDERKVVQSYHDALDAAGLALWAAGRWKQIRSYPGAV